jgi:two-component system CheB/CheR fusion protein
MANDEALEPDLRDLIRHIQERRGVDFRGYKKSSLRRRLLHRMEAVGADGFAAYHAFLEAHPQEFAELLNTVLINVTSFFRDPDAWEVVKKSVVPRIVERRQADREPIRVWSAGCATGEEPYSLAMLFAEELGLEDLALRIKIYATDLDEAALQAARHAHYAPRAVEGVPPALLERHFERTNNHHVVSRELRKCVIFGRHNLAQDAPIGRVDLLVCRNLLIYLETETQEQVLPRLHYALREGGFLFLGKAETQLARSHLFEPVDAKHRAFRKVQQEWRRHPAGSVFSGGPQHDRGPSSLHTRLLEAIADASNDAYLAVDQAGVLVFANLAARRLLSVAEDDIGRPFRDLPISYRWAELHARIEEAQRLGRPVRLEHQEQVRPPPTESVWVSVEITPLFGGDGRPYATLLAFTDTTRAFLLQQELLATQESLETHVEELQSANEELETTNEELQSTNEELETTNEELQSTNEELETMNEELRSTNEELEVAIEELRRQSEETVSYKRHVDAILRSLDAGIVVLDRDLKVLSWNRWNENTWGLRAEETAGQSFLELDIGLPVGRLRRALARALAGEEHPDLTLSAMDRRGKPLRCRVRISPLRHDGKPPQGAAVILEDVTEAERNAGQDAYLGRVIGQSLNEVYFLDPATLRFLLVNRGAERKLGHPLARLRRMSLADLMPDAAREELAALVEPLLSGKREEVVFETRMRAADGRTHPVEICMQHLAVEEPPILVAIVHQTAERQRLHAAE